MEIILNKYEIYVANVKIEAEGLNEYNALVSTALLGNGEDIHMIECVNPKEQVWIYSVMVNSIRTIACIKRIFE